MTNLPTPDLDLVESTELTELRATLRRALADRDDATTWQLLAAELGLAGLLVPETAGGAEAGPRAVAVVAEELGRVLSGAPYLTSAVLATHLLVRVGAATEVLASLAAGEGTAVVALPATTSPGTWPTTLTARSTDGDRAMLTGRVELVLGAAADLLVAPVLIDGEPALVLSTDSFERTEMVALDQSRSLHSIDVTGCTGIVLARGEHAEHALEDSLTLAAAVLCAERVGIMEWAVAQTATYLGQRYQFGALLGSYQSLRHAAARMWIDAGQARAITAHAVAAFEAQPNAHAGGEGATGTALAVSWTAPRGLAVVEQALQLHGGIGFTWEHPIHRYLKRAMADTAVFGTVEHHRSLVARATELAPVGAERN